MKRTLTSIFLLAIFTISSKIYAQCDLQFNNLVIQLVSTNDTLGSKCRITFNASFDINTNSGFKYLFFHSWLNEDYPNPAIFDCSGSSPAVNPGTAIQLGTTIDQVGKSFLDIGFIGLKDITDTLSTTNLVDVTSKFATSFPHDGSVELIKPANAPGLTALMSKTGSVLHFEVTNIKVIINATCGGPVGVFTDIWGSNSNAGDPKAQCYICKIPQFFNNPIISGFKICNNPRTYAISVTTIDPVLDDLRYKVFIDMDNDGLLDVGEPLAFTSGLINISSTQSYTPGGSFTLPFPYSHTNPYVAKGYIIQVDFEPPTTKNSVRKAFPNPPGCILLPVSLKSFTATRSNRANVSVKWETVSENNSAGFTVERKLKTDWEQVAYLPSLAFGGNSNSLLTYQINDVNDSKGISQYRIRQMDLDGVSKLSDIRSVRGEGQRSTTIIYPNPSSDGKVNVLFEGSEITKRDISVQDMNGRIIKQWKNYTNNNIQIENLTPGFYTVRVLDVGTGEQIVEKLVVNKR